MSTTDIDAIKKDLVDINTFVRERLDPVTHEVGLLKDETERLKQDLHQVQQRERSCRTSAIMGHLKG